MHIKGYLTFPSRCIITALVDIYPEKAQKRKDEFGLSDAKIYDSCEKMLMDQKVDLVSICTPPYTHAQLACACLEAGIHVVSEKPMAASLKECDDMLYAAKKSGKKLSVIAQNRFRTPVMNLKKTLDAGLIGPVRHVQIDSHWWRGHCYYDLWWRGSWEKEGGGCTLNHAVHHIDMLNWMMGLPDQVTAVLANVGHDNAEVEDLSIAVCSYPGALAQITSSVVHHGEDQNIIFQGELGKIQIPWETIADKSLANGFPEIDIQKEHEIEQYYNSLPKLQYEMHTGQIDNVMGAIENGTDVMISGEDGRKTIEIITAIYMSGCMKQTVTLPLKVTDQFYTKEGILRHAIHFYEKKKAVENFEDIAISTGSDYKKREV